MYNFEIIKLEDKLWDSYVKSANMFDFYHTSCYHKIEQGEGESPVLLVAKANEEFVCLPLIIKQITETDFFDATSVYGYCGPVASKSYHELNTGLIDFFKTSFLRYCNENKIVSVFSRLHSLIPQQDFFENFGEVIDLNKTVAIDLTLPLDEQRRSFRKSNKSEINQLKGKKGYVFQKIDNSDDESITEFVEIYLETMRKVEAKSYYFFEFNYFKHLLNNPCFECDLLVARKNDEMAAGAIFTKTNSIMQYHLAGTKDEYFKDTPMKLILDEARKIGTKEGLKYLNLGGGLGGSDEDSLFRFKSGFSKNFHQFSVWNLVVNQEVYDKLVHDKGVSKENHPNFFPLYRVNK